MAHLSRVGAGLGAVAGTVNRDGASPVAKGRRVTYLSQARWKGTRMTTLYQALMLLLDVVWTVMIVHIILSWLINFQVLNLRQPIVAQVWEGLSRLLEPIYGPIRRMLPQTGGLDFAPLVAFIVLIVLQRALANNAGWFYGY